MLTSAKQLYKTVFKANVAALQLIERVRTETMLEPTNIEELADTCLVVKKSLEILKELVTQFNTLERLTANLICATWMNGDGSPIRTPFVTATPQVKMMVKTPDRKREPKQYAEFCKFFGVSETMIESGAFTPHWPSMVDYISSAAAEGKPLPPHCDPSSQYPVFAVTCRKVGEILNASEMSETFDEPKKPKPKPPPKKPDNRSVDEIMKDMLNNMLKGK